LGETIAFLDHGNGIRSQVLEKILVKKATRQPFQHEIIDDEFRLLAVKRRTRQNEWHYPENNADAAGFHFKNIPLNQVEEKEKVKSSTNYPPTLVDIVCLSPKEGVKVKSKKLKE
jgi:hypothetical protein